MSVRIERLEPSRHRLESFGRLLHLRDKHRADTFRDRFAKARESVHRIPTDRLGHVRVSLNKWADREIETKTEALAVLDDLRKAIRAGTFDARGINPPKEQTSLTFREFATIYTERHVQAKGLALAKTIDYRLRPLLNAFGDRPLAEIRTGDIEDFIADLKKPRTIKRLGERKLTPASINRSIELLRHMFNWAVGREYLDKTPFRRGTETLIRKVRGQPSDAAVSRRTRKRSSLSTHRRCCGR